MAKAVEGDDIVKKGSLSEHIAQAKELEETYDKLDNKLVDLSKRYTAFKKSAGTTSAKGINDLNKAVRDTNILRQESVKIDNQSKIVKKQLVILTKEQEKERQIALRQRKEQRDLVKTEIVLNDRLAGTEERLLATNKKLRLERKKLTKGEIDYKKNLDRINRSLDRNNKLLRQGTDLDGKRISNIGRYKTALNGLNKVAGALGLTFAISQIGTIISDLNLLAEQAKGVEFAFLKLGDRGEKALENIRKSTRGFISDLEIKKALVNFDNFNISLEETDVLMEFLAVRAAQTGESIDHLKDSLVEGLSKESKLRIDNLGISAAQLNDELEKTPNFVSAVANIAKTEIAQAGTILDDAGSSQQRWNATLENFKLIFAKQIKPVFDEFYNFGARTLKFVSENLDDIRYYFNIASKSAKAFMLPITITNKALSLFGDLVTKIIDILPDFTSEEERNTIAIAENRKEQEKLNKELFERQRLLRNLTDDLLVDNDTRKLTIEQLKDLSAEYKNNLKDTEAFVKTYGVQDEKLKGSQQEFEKYVVSLSRGVDLNVEMSNVLNKRRQALLLLNKVEKELANRGEGGSTITKKTVDQLSQLEKDIIENQKENIATRKKNAEEAAEELYQGQVDIERRKIELEKQSLDIIGGLNDKALEDAQRRADEELAIEAERLKKEEELTKQRNQDILTDAKNTAQEVSNVVTQQYDEQIQASQNEIQARENSLNRLNGIETAAAAESRQAEKQAIAQEKIELRKLEDKKKDLLQIVLGLELASQNIGKGDQAPLANAFKGVTGLVNKLKGFYGGTEGTVADELGHTGVKDGHIVKVHDNEHIISANDSNKLHQAGFSKTSDIVDSAMAYQTQGLKQRAMRSSHRMVMNDKGIINELRSLKQEVKNIEITNTDIDLVNFTKTIQNSKMYQKTKYGGASIVV